jgi:hypothetical protein
VKVLFRPFAPVDILTLKQVMPFSATESMNGVVAYDAETHETLAVLVAQEWTHTCCYVHQVILKTFVIRHGWFEEVANWLFTIANRIKLYAMVPSKNERAVKLNTKLGFKEIVRLEDAYDHGEDFILMELKREECPYWTQPEMAEVVNG